MFGIGSTELLVILVVALIVLGPRSLASVSRSLGKAVGEFRRVSTDFQRTLNVETAKDELREAEEKRKRQAAASETKDANTNENFFSTPPEGINHDDAGVNNPIPASKTDTEFKGVPADSPLAQALQKANAEAAAFDSSSPAIDLARHPKNQGQTHA